MKKLVLALAVSTAASQVSAVALDLVSVNTYNSAKDSSSFFTFEAGQDATWDFDGTTLTSTGDIDIGMYIPTPLYIVQMSDAVFDMGGGATAASFFQCVDALFTFDIGASICANTAGTTATLTYNIGGDATNSTRTLNGSTADGDWLQLQHFDVDAGSVTWDGTTLEFDTVSLGTTNNHFILQAAAVPVPAAAWLFGSALLGLASIKRRK